VIVGSPNVNPGYKLVNNARYPEIADDYARGFRVLKSLPCDVFLGAHGGYYGMEQKYAKLSAGGANPYIDSEGYKNYVAEREQAFLARIAETNGGSEKAIVRLPSHMHPIAPAFCSASPPPPPTFSAGRSSCSALGAAVSALFCGAGRGIHAGDRAGGNGSRSLELRGRAPHYLFCSDT
jgi:hypothetical protein